MLPPGSDLAANEVALEPHSLLAATLQLSANEPTNGPQLLTAAPATNSFYARHLLPLG